MSQARHATVIGVDTGGTFTDVILLEPASGHLTSAKVPSSPADPSRSFAAGIAAALGQVGISGEAVERVLHGVAVQAVEKDEVWSVVVRVPAAVAGEVVRAVRTAEIDVTVRQLAKSEHPLVVVFYFPLIATPLAIPWAAYHWVWPSA